MSVMAQYQNRRTRIVITNKEGKEHIITRRTRQDVLDLFDNIVIKAFEKATLQSYVEDHGWEPQECKTYKPYIQ
jgi:hypothetical protein